MPIYEFRCRACGKKVELLCPTDAQPGPCAACGGRLERIMSRFAHHRSLQSRLADIDTSRPPGDDYYRDERNIGLWARKRMQELGCDPGIDFDGVVERARQQVKEQLQD